MHFSSAQNNHHPKCNCMAPNYMSRINQKSMEKFVFRTITYWQDSWIKNLKRSLGFLKISEILSFFSSLVSSMASLLSSFNSRLSKILWSKLLPLTFAIHSRTSIASSRRPCRKSHLWSFQNMYQMTVILNSDQWYGHGRSACSESTLALEILVS